MPGVRGLVTDQHVEAEFAARQVVQYTGPISLRRTCPRNSAPSAGPVAPSSHSDSNTSGEKRPVLRTSAMTFQILSAGADMVTVAEPCIATPPAAAGHTRCGRPCRYR